MTAEVRKLWTISECVLWPMWNGATLQIGGGSYGGGTRMRNCDVINPEWHGRGANQGFMASMVFPDSRNQDIVVEDVRIEGAVNALVNPHMRLPTAGRNTPEDARAADYRPKQEGWIRDITCRNVSLEHRQFWPQSWAPGPGKSLIRGMRHEETTCYVGGITFENLRIAGERITDANWHDHFEIDPETTRDIRFLTGTGNRNLRHRTTTGRLTGHVTSTT